MRSIYTAFHWVVKEAKIHTGANESDVEMTITEFRETVKISGKGFPHNIKILLKEYNSSLHWEKNEAPNVPSIHQSLIHPSIRTPFMPQRLRIDSLGETGGTGSDPKDMLQRKAPGKLATVSELFLCR